MWTNLVKLHNRALLDDQFMKTMNQKTKTPGSVREHHRGFTRSGESGTQDCYAGFFGIFI